MWVSTQLLQEGYAELSYRIEEWGHKWLKDSATLTQRDGRIGKTEKSIAELGLSAQSEANLARMGIETVDDFFFLSDAQLEALPLTELGEFEAILQELKDVSEDTEITDRASFSLKVLYEEILAETRFWADLNFADPPELGPTPRADNSMAIFAGVMMVLILIAGVAAGVMLHPLLALVAVPGIFLMWFVISSDYISPEAQHARHLRQHEASLSFWEESREGLANQLAERLLDSVIDLIAKGLGVPARLNAEFSAWMIDNSHRATKALRRELDEWGSQPEFPPAPGAEPKGLSHEEYEDYCRRTLLSWGYLDAKTTRYVRDGGIDIESDELVVQCKHVVGNVRAPEVQAIFGLAANRTKTAVVFSAGGYTRDAITFAREAGVALFKLTELSGKVTAVNEAAQQVVARRLRQS